MAATLKQEIAILHKVQPAPDHMETDKGEADRQVPMPGRPPASPDCSSPARATPRGSAGECHPHRRAPGAGQVLQESADVGQGPRDVLTRR